MKVFAISDLHLATNTDKPMDIFGESWQSHFERIKTDWQNKVSDEDLVLIAGDISWAMKLEDAKADLEEIGKLSGKKVIIRGNHDYWWTSLAKVRKALPASVYSIQNDALKFEDIIVCGTRGWTVSEKATEEEKKYIDRELIRLELSIKAAKKLKQNNEKIVLMMHYPPFNAKFQDSPFTEKIAQHGIKTVIYGHLHGGNGRFAPIVNKGDTDYFLTSCDMLDNKLIDLTDYIK